MQRQHLEAAARERQLPLERRVRIGGGRTEDARASERAALRVAEQARGRVRLRRDPLGPRQPVRVGALHAISRT